MAYEDAEGREFCDEEAEDIEAEKHRVRMDSIRQYFADLRENRTEDEWRFYREAQLRDYKLF